MNDKNMDYGVSDVVKFIKEELDRIITQYPTQREGSILSFAQAFEIWFLRQEMGIEYSEAAKYILDASRDAGVDFIWIDDKNRDVAVGQCEYDVNWERNAGNVQKAIDTFKTFRCYLSSSVLPESLNEASQRYWQLAKQRIANGFTLKYYYVTPKYFSQTQEYRIREKSGIPDYIFITHDTLIERAIEFLDGQTGMCNFKIRFCQPPLKIVYDFGAVHIFPVKLKEIHRIVEYHKDSGRLRALFASNVRAYLSTKRRSKEIGEAIRSTIKKRPNEFLICNNGITLQCEKALVNDEKITLERASISNGCQTVMNINAFFIEYPDANPDAEVLTTVVELRKESSRLAGEIAIARNFQNPVDNRDLMSNNYRLVCLHHRLLAERIIGSDRKYYLLRKQGEKQTILKEEPHAKGQYLWIDSDELARCISAVIRQEPFLSRQGTNDLFGKHFSKIFPDITDPSHTRCRYSWWLFRLFQYSIDPKAKWRGIKDNQISNQRDFKSPAIYYAVSLMARKMKENYRVDESLEKRLVEKAEKWWFKSRATDSQEFGEIINVLADDTFRLLYAIARTLLGKKLPNAREPYNSYEEIFKGNSYPVFISEIRKGKMKKYQSRFDSAMKKLYLLLCGN